jgi:Rrf2 family protein
MITKTTKIALKLLLKIANSEQHTSVQLLAEDLGDSKSYISKIATQLTKAGILVSQRGVSGGLSIAMDPKEITIYDVMAVTQGHPSAAYCSVGKQDVLPCGYHKAMVQLYDGAVRVLKSWTLFDLLQKPCGSLGDGSALDTCNMYFNQNGAQ